MASELKTPELSRNAAAAFADKWKSYTDEKQDARGFWSDFFRTLCGVDDEEIAGIEYEKRVKSTISGNQEYIDVYWKNVALIEHKSAGQNLDKAELQARGYWLSLPPGYRPKTIIISDFLNFRLIDVALNRTHDFPLSKLPENIHRFEAIISGNRTRISEEEITVDQVAAKLMANLYLELEDHGFEGHETSIFLIRILFLLFGDDTGMWTKNTFLKLVMGTKEDGTDIGPKLDTLFEVLNTSEDKRPKDLGDDFKSFPYVNGGIFAEKISVINFNKKMRVALVDVANYDWTTINPTIFGSLFQLIKNKEARRELGEHYTSEENINKIVYPLFLDELQERLASAWDNKKELKKLRQDLAKIKVFDPACGCGNFLVVSYRHLRQLELELIVRLNNLEGKQESMQLDGSMGLSITLNQFYGIEIEEWPAQVARMALFLTDHQENLRLERITGATPNRFPIKDYANIHNANALQSDWRKIVKFDENLFILGNPPFIGSRMQSNEQRADQEFVWTGTKGFGMSDYVSCWFILAAKFARGSSTRCAFVATSSITQGDQAANIYGLLQEYGYEIDFAHRSFAWSNESSGVAAVHCVIVGFSMDSPRAIKRLWDYPDPKDEPTESKPKFINAYLVDGPNVLIRARKSPFEASLPSLLTGNEPRDGGHLSNIKIAEANEIRASDPVAAKYLRVIMGSDELMNGVGNRFCLWLVDASPTEISKSKTLKSRVQAVRDNRLKAVGTKSSKARTADTPTLFSRIAQPNKRFMAVPSVSSEKRDYIPIAFFDKDVIVNNAIFFIESEDLALFALLQSRPFTVWVQNVSSRLESRYQISASAVYNTFPFPILNEKTRVEVENLASEILSERDNFKDSKLGDLYDPLLMPGSLLKLHKRLDSVVLRAFGLNVDATDSRLVSFLFNEYARLSDDKLL
jgi:type I restriction-modification system DNA methylase subunit